MKHPTTYERLARYGHHEPDRPICHDPATLAAQGWEFTDTERADTPAYPTMRLIAKRLDYPMESLHWFRHAPDSWGLWVKPGAVKGFVEPGPILPP